MQSIDLLTTVANNRLDLRLPPPLFTLDGVLPDFTVFGVEFTRLWQQLLFGLWALAVIAAIVYVVRGLLGVARVRRGAQQQSSIYPSPPEEH